MNLAYLFVAQKFSYTVILLPIIAYLEIKSAESEQIYSPRIEYKLLKNENRRGANLHSHKKVGFQSCGK